MKSKCDPNGIRTRVTAVKGRCPGPLDDRVTKARAISELPLFHARQIANPEMELALDKSALQLVFGMKLVNQRGRARSCTAVRAQNFMRVADQSLSRFAIAQKLDECLFE